MQWRSRHFLNDRFTQQKSLVAHQLDRPNRTWSDESVHRERSSKNIGDWKSVQFPKMSDGIFNILIPFGRNVFLETWIQAWFLFNQMLIYPQSCVMNKQTEQLLIWQLGIWLSQTVWPRLVFDSCNENLLQGFLSFILRLKPIMLFSMNGLTFSAGWASLWCSVSRC